MPEYWWIALIFPSLILIFDVFGAWQRAAYIAEGESSTKIEFWFNMTAFLIMVGAAGVVHAPVSPLFFAFIDELYGNRLTLSSFNGYWIGFFSIPFLMASHIILRRCGHLIFLPIILRAKPKTSKITASVVPDDASSTSPSEK